MTPSIVIAVRFLLAKKRSMLMSLAGISFGVAFFIVTQAQVSGFKEYFIDTVLATDGAIRISDKMQPIMTSLEASTTDGGRSSFMAGNRENYRFIEGVEFPSKIIEAIRELPNVYAASPVVTGNVYIRGPLRNGSGFAYGISIEDHLAVSALEDQIVEGSIDDFRSTPMGILIGRKLANRLQAQVGDSLLVQAVDQRNRFHVVGIYETGVSEIDKVRVFLPINQARSLFKMPHRASFIQVSLFDRSKALVDAQVIENLTRHFAASWQEREKSWLQFFYVIGLSAAITVSAILLTSGLGMFNTLAMIVMEKTREIAILRSVGYSRRDISNIFIWQGMIVLVLGTLIGFCFGAGMTYAISNIPIGVKGIFTAERFVVNWSLQHYIYAALVATVIVLFASLAPARRAARLVPGEVIRGTAS